MIKIDQEKCIGCGACVEDCFTRDLVLADDKAQVLNKPVLNVAIVLLSVRLMRSVSATMIWAK